MARDPWAGPAGGAEPYGEDPAWRDRPRRRIDPLVFATWVPLGLASVAGTCAVLFVVPIVGLLLSPLTVLFAGLAVLTGAVGLGIAVVAVCTPDVPRRPAVVALVCCLLAVGSVALVVHALQRAGDG